MEAWSQLLANECSRAHPDLPQPHPASQHVAAQSFKGDRMRAEAHQKVKPSHLKRTAYLYVRQSSLRQVFENTESTKRQYALRQHAIALMVSRP
jgi:hypothetical protein